MFYNYQMVKMTQKEKQLLLADLSARLPYGVKVNNEIQGDFIIYGVCEDYVFARTITKHGWINHVDFHVEKIKPYLFPISSMTKEQRKECKSLMISDSYGILYHTIESFDYLYKNHIDVRGLIPKGLANDATGLNIY